MIEPRTALPPHVEVISPLTVVPFEGADWYDLADHEHPWMAWRFAEAVRTLGKLGIDASTARRALDVGGGVGVVRDQFEAATDWSVDLAEVDLTALRKARPGRGRTLHYDILERRPEFEASYDVVVLFDVLEHIEDTAPFMDALAWYLRPGGHLLLNVPALPAVRSRYDDAAGHVRRYTKAALTAELPAALQLRSLRAWGVGLIPLLVARKAWLGTVGRNHARSDILEAGFKAPSRNAAALVQLLVRAERRLGDHTPLGASLMLAAQRLP